MEQIIAQIVSGAIGGAGGGKVVQGSSMGSLGNLLAGAVGGVGGGSLLGGLMGAGGAAADAAGGGGIGAIAPEVRPRLAKIGVRAMFGGALASFMTATIAGILYET